MTSKRSTRIAFGAGAALLTLLLTAALALAGGVMRGTAGDDTITGTDKRDKIRAFKGNDTIKALAGRDRIRAGRGNDGVEAGDGHDIVFSGWGDDTVNGGPGADLIFAQQGADTISGGPGPDRLWALAGVDVTKQAGEPADTLDGGFGNDRFYVRDGEADKVTCGPGFDRVRADYKDVVANDCERLSRHGPRKRDDRTENEHDDD